jgi:lipopolysaccharide transport system ATP-binding protein
LKTDQSDPSLPAVRLEDVTKIYDLYNSPGEMLFYTLGIQKMLKPKREVPRFTALKNISFSIGKGERVGLIGRNGAGKTTTLRLITGNYPPTTGKVEVQGSVQALMQLGLGFHPEFTGYENIKAALNYNGLLGTQLEEAIADVVEFCELGAFLHQPLKTYSLGMQSRVQFAAATAIYPDILIVDEVLGAGDAYFSAKSALRMERLAKSGCTLLMVSHSWQMIQQYCERAIWLEAGNVRMDGPAFEVLAAYESHIAGATAKFHAKGDEIPVSEAEPWKMVESQFSTRPDSSNESDQGSQSMGSAASAGPDYASVSWIADHLRKKEDINGDQETALKLSDGRTVFRVAGVNGLRFSDFRVLVDGTNKNVVRTGGAIAIEMELVAQRSDHFACSYWIHFFGLDGMRLARVRSPIDKFELKEGEKRRVSVHLDPVLLGTRDYLLSFSVFDNKSTESSADTLHQRFDMLPRCFQLKVLGSNDSDAPILHHNGGWHFGGSEQITPAVIKDYI